MAKFKEWVFTADGNGESAPLNTAKIPLKLDYYGDIGGGTITFQYKPAGSTVWKSVTNAGSAISVSDVSTEPYIVAFSQEDEIRAILTGSTSPSLTVVASEAVI